MTSTAATATEPTATPWWREAVVYQIYPRSFADADGDGVGDLRGIRSRLGHVAALGVDAVWVSPFYPSPQADGGYDVADYRDVDPVSGTLADFDALVADAHALGVRVIVDLVPNHTSDRHPWFQAALAAPPGSAERARYIFREGRGRGGALPPNDWQSVFGGPAWQRVADGQWYLHLFAPEQPDLDWSNPEVRAEFRDILRFWLDRGVDGFRIDVAHGLLKHPALPDLGPDVEAVLEPTKRINHPFWDRDDVLEVYEEWRALLDSYEGERMLVAEAWVANPRQLARYVAPGRLHTAFNFDFLKSPWHPTRMRTIIDECIDATQAVGAPTTWVLSNHDVVRVVTRYGRPQPPGGYHDAMEMESDTSEVDLELGRRRARAAALLMFALPGSAYVYQGEELGLEEVEDLPEEVLQDPAWERSGRTVRGRDGCRVPLPWSGDAPPFGFGPPGSTPWLPQPARWAALTAEAQADDPGSMLSLYRRALLLRRRLDPLGDGALRWLETPERVLGFAREPGFACFVNFGTAAVSLPEGADVLLASSEVVDGQLGADSAAWLAVH